MKNRAASRRLNLYQINNYDRRESLIALVADGFRSLVTRLKAWRPPPIEHWGPDEAYAVETIATAGSAADAEERLKGHLAKSRWCGWKIHVWRG